MKLIRQLSQEIRKQFISVLALERALLIREPFGE
jgi:hypothetical protein